MTIEYDDFDLATLDPEVRRVIMLAGKGEDNESGTRLDQLGQMIAEKRDAAVKHRRLSGIEETWMECEEAYLGIDDENRHEYMGSRWAKPTTMTGPITTDRRPNSSNVVKSTAYVKVTSRYVDAGSAKLGEILLPIDDKAFSFGPSPVPELIELKGRNEQVMIDGQPAMRDVKPGEAVGQSQTPPTQEGQQPPATAQPATVPLTYADLAEEAMAKAMASAKAAEKRLYDWMVQSQYPAEMRKVIFDSARIGTGILKGPFPEARKKHAVKKDAQGKPKLVINEEINPSVRWIDPWNFYPDDTCGENVHHGEHVFEKDLLSPRLVRDLKKNKAYLPDQLSKVLLEGPQKSGVTDEREMQMDQKVTEEKRFEVWYFYGVISRADMKECYAQGLDAIPEGQDDVYAIVTMINTTVIRATINPLESGKFPYHVVPWRRRPGHWAGVGVAEQIRMPQRMINAATRALLVNAAKTAGSQIVVDRGCIEPADKSWIITPDKIWFKTNDAKIDDVNKAFSVFEFPNVQKEMLGIVEYGFRLAEESCSIPLISQGQSGKTTPDTLGGQQLQDNNANQLLRSVGYAFDDFVTEPVVLQYYEWLLLDPDVPDEEKGDWNINAHGSASLVERSIQNTTIGNILGAALNPAYGADPFKTYSQYLRSQRLDPRDFQMDKEEFDKAKEQPQPKAPAIEVATIRSQSAEKIAQVREETAQTRIKVDTDRDMAYVQAESERNKLEHEGRMIELQLRERLAMLEYSNSQNITLEQLKIDLAKSTQNNETKLTLAQRELEFAAREGMFGRTHDKMSNSERMDNDVKLTSLKAAPSLVRDEVSTNVTP